MDLSGAVQQTFWHLLSAARGAIAVGVNAAWTLSNPNAPEEADFVAGLVHKTVPVLARDWSAVLAPVGIHLSVASVYCHQSPKVEYAGIAPRNSCELGDILFAHFHTPLFGRPWRRSILYQAKASSSQPHTLGANELHQMRLYTHWPDFTYVSPSPLTGARRYVSPKRAHSGARYMQIDDRQPTDPLTGMTGVPGYFPIGTCSPGPTLSNLVSLDLELTLWAAGAAGRPFLPRPQSAKTSGWSRVIWDLIDNGLKRPFTRSRTGYVGYPRIPTPRPPELDGTCFVAAYPGRVLSTASEVLGVDRADFLVRSACSDRPPPSQSWEESSEGEGGVSIVLVETVEGERPG